MDTESRYSLRPAYRIIDAWVAARPENGPDACTDFDQWTKRLCELKRGHDGPHLALIVWGLPTPTAGEEQPG